MSCLNLHSSPDADRHVRLRYVDRNLMDYLGFDELKDKILEYCKKGLWVKDKKHLGLDGSRYTVHISVANYQKITVIVEKTSKCLLPITVWL